ncbi:MAG: hypothetical protein HOP11_07100 [Saprospiraceae bacterium]|nr:hypothetical protein [Saprospiraceae bacterium]
MKAKCRMCKTDFKGRADKIFCSIVCKNSYHLKLRNVTAVATTQIDTILHRNRSILLEILGKKLNQLKVDKKLLDSKKFNWTYITHYHINSNNKFVNYVYDFSWIVFSDQEVLIKRIG